jgi:hypothetical protein
MDGMDYPQILFECENGLWYISTNGALGQRDMSIGLISEAAAKKLIRKRTYNEQ